MMYRIVASILLLAALGALALFQDSGTQPAAAFTSTPSGVTADDSAMKALKLN